MAGDEINQDASGGVGRFAVQLAARAGAHVIAAVGNAHAGPALPELGSADVVIGLDDVSVPVYGVLDNVGGPLLPQAFGLLSEGGSAHSIGMASGQPTTIDFEAEHQFSIRKRLEPFNVRVPFGPDLEYLLELLTDGGLVPQIGLRDSWDNGISAAQALLSRQVSGKVVREVS